MRQTTLFERRADDPSNEYDLPRLRQRSHEEILFSALVLQILRDLSSQSLATCLVGGDKLGLVDAHFPQLKAAAEWDGGYFHNKQGREEGDVKKTRRILSQNPDLTLVRLRVGARDVEELQNIERCVVIVVPPGASVEYAVFQFSSAMQSRAPEPFASLLRSAQQSALSRRSAEHVVCKLRCECDDSFARAFKRLCVLVGGNAQKIVSSVHGARSNLVAIVDALQRLKEEWKMEKGDLCKFMSNSVAAAVSGEKADLFWKAVDKLKGDWKMEKGDLCKFMSNSVAAAVSGEKADAFWEGMACLRPFLTPAQMSSLMSDGVACRMKKRGYGRDIATIVHRLGFDTAKGLLRDTSVLNVVPELAASVSDEVPGILRHGKRKALFFERLKSQKLAKLQDRR